jgi:hypothetical protein
LKIQKSFAKKMEFRNGKVPATSDSSAGSLVLATAFKRNKKAELLRGSKKKRNEEKVKTE